MVGLRFLASLISHHCTPRSHDQFALSFVCAYEDMEP
jgi:hypothetical protein